MTVEVKKINLKSKNFGLKENSYGNNRKRKDKN